MVSVIRFVLDFLFYLLLGWITRIVLCVSFFLLLLPYFVTDEDIVGGVACIVHSELKHSDDSLGVNKIQISV